MVRSEATMFRSAVQPAVAHLQAALTELLSGVPGDIKRPMDLRRVLGIDYKVCWHVFQVVHASDALAAAKAAPTPGAMKRFFIAAERVGVDAGVVGRARQAVDEFAGVIARHAHDRGDFDAMAAASASDEQATASDLAHRKAAYKSMSHLWGSRVEVACGTVLVRASASGNGTDECGVVIKRGLTRLRPGASAIVQWHYHHTSQGATSPMRWQAIDPVANEKYGIPLLPEFCSQPLPELKVVPRGKVGLQYELADGAIGCESLSHFTIGRIAREVPFSIDGQGKRVYRFGFACSTSTGLIIKNLLVHRPSFGVIDPELVQFQTMPGDEDPEVARSSAQLRSAEPITRYESALDAPGILEVPRYQEMLRQVADAVGWDLRQFDLYRVRVPYPVFGSVVRLQCVLP